MSATTPDLAFTISDAALAQIRVVMSQQPLEADEKNLRIFVESSGGGCCGGGGMGFGLAFDRVQPDDLKLERGGLPVVVDPASAPWVNGATIDWVSTPEMTGFKVSAPPMQKSGGCGSGGGGGCGSGGGGGCGSGGGHSHSHGDAAHSHDHGHGHDHGHSHGGCGSQAPAKQQGGCGSGGCC